MHACILHMYLLCKFEDNDSDFESLMKKADDVLSKIKVGIII